MFTCSPRTRITTWYVSVFLLAVCSLWPENARSQQDTSFWFVAPATWTYHSPAPTIFKLASGLAAVTNVTITRPADPGNGWQDIQLTLGPNDIAHVEVDADLLFPINLSDLTDVSDTVPDQVTQYGIHIQSDQVITGYYENSYGHTNPDIFALKGRNALGTEFVTPFQDIWHNVTQNQWGPANSAPKSGFDIVATENNTEVYIVATGPVVRRTGGVYQAGDTITFTLNRGETYRIKAASRLANKRLAGSIVRSTKPIAITTWDDSVLADDCGDLIGDQMVPASAVGQEYVVMSAFANAAGRDDQIIVQPLEANTSITITDQWGWTQTQTHSRTNPWTYNHTSITAYVTANKPVYVFHIAGNGCELGGAYLPPIDNCTGSQEVAFVRSPAGNPDYSINEFILNIAVRSGHEDNFEFEGFRPGFSLGTFQPLNGSNGDWMYIRQTFDSSLVPVDENLRITNSTGLFHLGVINGEESDGGTKYGYFSSFANLDLGSPDVLCDGSEIELDAGETAESYLWSTGETSRFISVQAGDVYTVSATFPNGCVGVDAVEIAAQYGPDIDLGADFALCHGPVILDATAPNATYLWDNGAVVSTRNVTQPGIYAITATARNSCTTVDSLVVFPDTDPQIDLIDRHICQGGSTEISAGEFEQYIWSTGAQSSVITVDSEGGYSVTITDTAGCQNSAAMTLTFHEQLPIQLQNQAICDGDALTLNPGVSSNYDFIWSNGATTEEITVTQEDNYDVTVTDDNDCRGTGGMHLFILALPDVWVPDGQFCDDGTYLATATSATAVDYKWSNGGPVATVTFNQIGTHSVTVTDDKGCQSSTTFELSHFDNPVPVILDTVICPEGYYHVVAPEFAEYQWSAGPARRYRSFNAVGAYGLTVTDDNGCHGSTHFNIGHHTSPVLVLEDGIECPGDPYVVNPGTFAGYQWEDGDLTQWKSFLQPGAYYLTITDDNGCKASDSLVLSHFDLPDPQFTPVEPCAKAGTALTLQQSYSAYQWNTGSQQSFETIEQDSEFSVTVTDANNCQNSASTIVDMFGVPKLTAAMDDPEICYGQAAELLVHVSDPDNNGPYTLDLVINGQTTSYPGLTDGTNPLSINTSTSTDVIGLSLTSSRGCAMDESELGLTIPPVVVHPRLEINSKVAGADCHEGLSGAQVTFELAMGTPPWNLTYSFEGEIFEVRDIVDLTYQINHAAAGTYALESAVDAHTCQPETNQLPFYIDTPLEPPVVNETAIELTPSCHGVRIEAAAFGELLTNVEWTANNRSSTDNPADFHVPYSQSVNLSLVATSEFCSQTIDSRIAIGDFDHHLTLNQQNVFTPDGDGFNDVFEMDPDNFYAECSEMKVFNRWGTMIYEGVPGDSKWDGLGMQGNAPEGTYYVVFYIGDHGTVNRSLTLFRGK